MHGFAVAGDSVCSCKLLLLLVRLLFGLRAAPIYPHLPYCTLRCTMYTGPMSQLNVFRLEPIGTQCAYKKMNVKQQAISNFAIQAL